MSLTAQQTLALPAVAAGAAASGSDYKALVFVFMNGGNDAHSTFIPGDSAGYTSYLTGRQALAVGNNAGAPNIGAGAGQLRALTGTTWTLHPSLAGFATLYNAGDMAIIANVGNLIEPVTKAQFLNPGRTQKLPYSLFSHNDQQAQFRAAKSDGPSQTGWGGRIADLLQAAYNPDQLISPCISVAGASLFLSGNNVNQYQVSTTGAIVMTAPTPWTTYHGIGQHTHLLEREVERIFVSSRDSATAVNGNITADPNVANPGRFPATSLGAQLGMVARMIGAAGTPTTKLRQRRQIFNCEIGGFDLHGAGSLTAHDNNMQHINNAIVGFMTEMASVGLANNVTLVLCSEFGRAQLLNGQGTDHGWGGHAFVFGGAVNGGALYGTPVVPEIGGPQDAGQGRLVPTTSVQQLAAPCARWLGIPDAVANGVNPIDVTLPGLTNFGARNLGFLP